MSRICLHVRPSSTISALRAQVRQGHTQVTQPLEREREKKTIEFVKKMLKAFELVKQHSELIPLPQRPPIVF